MEAIFSTVDEWFDGSGSGPPPPATVAGDQARTEASASEGPAGYERGEGTLTIEVSDPQKAENNMMTHLIYTVRCWTTLSTYANRQNCVQRRFSDFEWLRGKLRESNPGIIIPAVPEKTLVNYDDPACETIQDRLAGLNAFVTQVAAHPILRTDKSLQLFLESGCAELSSWYDRGMFGSMSTTVLGSVTSLFDSFMNGPGHEIASTLGATTAPPPPATVEPDQIPKVPGFTDDDFKYHDSLDGPAVQAYLTKLQGCLSKLVEHSESLVEHSAQEAKTWKSFTRSLIAIGEAEGQAVTQISSMAALQKSMADANTTYNWGQIGTYMRAWVVGPHLDQPNKIKAAWLRPLKFSARLATAALEMVNDRESVIQERKQVIVNYVAKKEYLDTLVITKGAGEEVDNARAEFLEAEKKRKVNNTKYECFEARSVKELAFFHSQVQKALGPALRGFAQVQGRLPAHTVAAMMKVNVPGGTLTDPTGLPIPGMLQATQRRDRASSGSSAITATTSAITSVTTIAAKTIISTASTAAEYAGRAAEYVSDIVDQQTMGDDLYSGAPQQSTSSHATSGVQADLVPPPQIGDNAPPPWAPAPPPPVMEPLDPSDVDIGPPDNMESIDLSNEAPSDVAAPDSHGKTNPFEEPNPFAPEPEDLTSTEPAPQATDPPPFVMPPPVVYAP